MTWRYLYYNGLTGPMIYEDTYTYPDGVLVEGARLSQAVIDADPTMYYHVVRKSYLDSTLTSTSELISTAQSAADLAIDNASVALSKGVAVEITASEANSVAASAATVASTAYSVANSAGVVASTAIVNASIADSKAESAAVLGSGGGITSLNCGGAS